jgi:hypothetical protein
VSDTSDQVSESSCDFCSTTLQGSEEYLPRDSARGARVVQCRTCGLIQSKYVGIADRQRHAPSISSDAGWGNIRHGKALRIDATWPVLSDALASLVDGSKILDVGTNRGDFLRRALHEFPDFRYTGVEPDESLELDWTDLIGASIQVGRLETVSFPDSPYELIFCYHTLEHADSATSMLQDLRNLIQQGGTLLLEVPDVKVIEEKGVVEEFFIDKHSFHFSSESLRNLLSATGWRVTREFSDGRNIGLVCAPDAPSAHFMRPVPRLDLASYGNRLSHNRAKLRDVAQQIQALEQRQEVCLWGAGRLFDSLWRFGGLRLEKAVVVDTYLSRHLDNINGVEIVSPDILFARDFDVCVILARGAAVALQAEARRLGVRHTTTFDELFLPLVDN